MAVELLRGSPESYWVNLLPDLMLKQTQKPLLKENTALTMNLQHISLYTHKHTADL